MRMSDAEEDVVEAMDTQAVQAYLTDDGSGKTPDGKND